MINTLRNINHSSHQHGSYSGLNFTSSVGIFLSSECKTGGKPAQKPTQNVRFRPVLLWVLDPSLSSGVTFENGKHHYSHPGLMTRRRENGTLRRMINICQECQKQEALGPGISITDINPHITGR